MIPMMSILLSTSTTDDSNCCSSRDDRFSDIDDFSDNASTEDCASSCDSSDDIVSTENEEDLSDLPPLDCSDCGGTLHDAGKVMTCQCHASINSTTTVLYNTSSSNNM